LTAKNTREPYPLPGRDPLNVDTNYIVMEICQGGDVMEIGKQRGYITIFDEGNYKMCEEMRGECL